LHVGWLRASHLAAQDPPNKNVPEQGPHQVTQAMDIKQAFAELGLTAQASPAEAKAAYRTLAMRWHPDVNTGTETDSRMKRINVAYALVCQHLDACERAGAYRTPQAARPESGFFEFDWNTGFRSARPAPAKPRDACVPRTLRVSLFEAAFGCVKRVNGMESDTCGRCAGSGEAPGTWTVDSKCLKCFGRGCVSVFGCFGAQTPCDACKGSGVCKPAPPACPACKGAGKAVRQAWMVDVSIHPGTLDGMVVEGSDIRSRAGAEARPHNFQLTVQIEKHPFFTLNQSRLSVSMPISVWRWALGGEITVPTLEGSARVSLPNKPSALLVKDQGWPEYKAPRQRKPLYVLPRIIYPERLRHEERRMLEIFDLRSELPEVRGWNRNVQAWVESSEQDMG
jgi:molecular chaperone DnaJ